MSNVQSVAQGNADWHVKSAASKKIDRWDYRDLFPFFETEVIDCQRLSEFVDYRFQNNPGLLAIAKAFARNIERIEKGAPIDTEFQLITARSVLSMMMNLGQVGHARKFLAASVEKWGQHRFKEVSTMLTMADTDIERLDIADKQWKDYQLIDRGHETTVLLFCGLGWKFGIDLSYMALWLRSLPVNVAYIRDQNARLYLAGLKSLGNLDESINVIKQDLARIGTRRVIAMGNSGGVYGALHYGYLLGAAQVLCFAGPTSLEPGKMESAERPVYEQVNEMIVRGEIKEPDIRSYLKQSGMPVRFFYGQDYAFDAAQVATIDGIPNVSIEPLEGWKEHFVVGELARRGKLKGILADMLKA